MSDIQLELLLNSTTNLLQKRMFLYVDDPSVDPTYLSIADLFAQIDINFSITNLFTQIRENIDDINVKILEIDTINRALIQLTNDLNAVESVANLNKSNIESIQNALNTINNSVSNHELSINTINQKIIEIDDNIVSLTDDTENINIAISQMLWQAK